MSDFVSCQILVIPTGRNGVMLTTDASSIFKIPFPLCRLTFQKKEDPRWIDIGEPRNDFRQKVEKFWIGGLIYTQLIFIFRKIVLLKSFLRKDNDEKKAFFGFCSPAKG